MTRLLAPFLVLTFPALTFLALTGCGEESSRSPQDGRDFAAQDYVAPGSYSGVVIDGYLRNARVWLDLDGDWQYTSGPVSVVLPSGAEVTLAQGEPTTMTGAGGHFTLDTTGLMLDPMVAPDLDPRDYPLIALAVPGQTVDESYGGGRLVERAFMLTAMPGIRTVTPLTTLLHFRDVSGVTQSLAGAEALAGLFRDINLRSDYIRSGDARAHAYAQAFARFLARQFPDDASAALAVGDGTERVLAAESVRLMAVSFARNAGAIVATVDEAAPAGHYENVDISALALPYEPLDLNNPVLLSKQVVYAHDSDGSFPSQRAQLERSAELRFEYSADGRLQAVVAEGCMTPSMKEIARLANANGYMADTDIQWLPGISLSQLSQSYLDAPGDDERLLFDWDNREALFETTTSCQEGLVASDQLGGEPALRFQWTVSGGKVDSITDGERTLVPDYQQASSAYWGGVLSGGAGDTVSVQMTGDRVSCESGIGDDIAALDRVISAQQAYIFSGYDPQPAAFSGLMLQFDDRGNTDRLLSHSFLDPGIAALLGLDAAYGYRWQYFYQSEGVRLTDLQPNLIEESYLERYSGTHACGSGVDDVPANALFARVSSIYGRLSEVLAGDVR
ncbi:hypothetical protein [Marinobacter sp. SS21]|uniref:hypothetical protein n=1 Tax=Marinobacter sp. SS21 TaxID=2979460 RepID=UPI00232AE266|nr:hypothetical protein [Marinobacter sp. SS21]MDC0662517.1 hypothetical protein [Marinobacter sp. SS21]